MSPESQQIAIAEACGFKITRIEYDGDGKIYRVWAVTPDSWTGKDVRPWLPDYLNDLNAMHEAEKILDYEEAEQYVSDLQAITINAELFMDNPPPSNFACLTAKAAQRAEAFLKTINKWTNDN